MHRPVRVAHAVGGGVEAHPGAQAGSSKSTPWAVLPGSRWRCLWGWALRTAGVGGCRRWRLLQAREHVYSDSALSSSSLRSMSCEQ